MKTLFQMENFTEAFIENNILKLTTILQLISQVSIQRLYLGKKQN